MLEGLPVTTYGSDATHVDRLQTVGGSVSVAAAVETTLTVGLSTRFGYLVYMRADCTAAGTTAGSWALKIGLAGTTVLNLQMATAAAPAGTSYCWPFPVPWKTSAQAGVFTVTPSAATLGTWVFIVNGFYSSL